MYKYELYLFGHDDYESTGQYFFGNFCDEAYAKARWVYPHFPRKMFWMRIHRSEPCEYCGKPLPKVCPSCESSNLEAESEV